MSDTLALPFGDKLHYSIKEVETITELSRTTLTHYEKQGLMPKRILLGVRRRFFLGKELQDWYKSRLQSSQ